MIKRCFFCLLLPACCFLILFCSCSYQKEKIYKKTRALMDTIVTITVVTDSEAKAERSIDEAFMEIEKIEKLSDFYSPDSQISVMNKNAGVSPVKVSDEIYELLEKSQYVSEKTDGAFDVTIGPVSMLYDFHKKIRPDESAIRVSLPLVNYRDMIMDKKQSTVYLRKKGMRADTGGIAKGFAADKAMEILRNRGVRSGIVAVGGDIRTMGMKPDGTPWKIGIRNPRSDGREDDVLATIDLSNGAISTSGDYERYFIADEIRYHHLLNPATGHPAHLCRSVSVITGEAVLTDAFATGIFILGPERGLRVLEKLGFEGIIIDNQGEMHMTSGIRGKLEFQKPAQ